MRFWLILIAVLGILLLLKTQFPYAVANGDSMLRVLYLVILLVLVAGGSGMARRMNMTQAARDGFIWLVIVLALVLGYSYRGDIRGSRLFSELVPSRIQQTSDGGYSIAMGQDGHFHLEAEINGALLNFMIDSGASDIVLSPRDAAEAGYDIQTLNYTRTYETANGTVSGAPVRIDTMMVGPITLRDMPASVNGAEMDTSLLGMAFLKQFRRYDVNDNTLTFYP